MQEISDPVTDSVALPTDGRSAASQIVAQQAAIAQIGLSALDHTSLEELFAEACSLISRVLETELVSLLEISQDRKSLKVVAGVGWNPGTVGELVVGMATDSQSGYTIATGEPVIVSNFAEETRFKVNPSLIEHGAVSGMSVRVGDAEKPFGVLAAFTRHRGRFTRDDANFLQAVANVLAAAVSRFKSEAELRASRDQLEAIVATLDEGIMVRSQDKIIFANDAAARINGYKDATELPADSNGLLARFELFDESGKPLPIEQLPSRRALAGETNPQAVIGFRFPATGEMRWSQVRGTGLRDEKGNVTHVISTFREVTEERWSRESRAFMAEAIAALSSTLDSVESAQRLANLAVPRLADYCTVHMVGSDGNIRVIALAHNDPERVRIADRLRQIRPVTPPDAPSGIAKVIRASTPEMGEVRQEMIDAVRDALSDEEYELVSKLDMHWYISVPLLGRSGSIGALSLIMAESGRILGERELVLAQELGARAGIALENARLFQESDDRRAQLDAVLGALAEAVLVFDGKGNLELANRTAEKLFAGDLPRSNKELMDRFTVDETEGPVPEDAASHEGQLRGSSRWWEVSQYGKAPTVVVIRDVTASRETRAARDAFLGVLSHELRTPITTIYGGSELLGRNLSPERRDEVMSDIRVESERLARLVEDLLIMTRVERGTVEIADEPILVQRLLPSIIHAFKAQRPELEVTLNLSERLSAVRGDPTYVEQVVRNLMTNAVRYGRATENGIEVTADELDGEVRVCVLDRGPGITDGDAERLFELFYRSEVARAVPGGAGIGLFVCRHLIEAMGGRIWAKSRADGGAEFAFTLPIVESDL
jgi:PAS domain S-box-containing protein